MFTKIKNDGDKQHLQIDLGNKSEKWQMLLNFGKCKCLRTGYGNLDVNYKMGDTVTLRWNARLSIERTQVQILLQLFRNFGNFVYPTLPQCTQLYK